jgi:hypothetical protein
MTSLIAGSVARKLSVYFKNVTADTLSLSFLKGQALLPSLGLTSDGRCCVVVVTIIDDSLRVACDSGNPLIQYLALEMMVCSPFIRLAELREDVFHEMLDLPSFVAIEKAICSSVTARISWTKLKSQPVRLV